MSLSIPVPYAIYLNVTASVVLGPAQAVKLAKVSHIWARPGQAKALTGRALMAGFTFGKPEPGREPRL